MTYSMRTFVLICMAAMIAHPPDAGATRIDDGPGINAPRLTVLIVVDAMRADYLTRFSEMYAPDGGLKRLLNQGTVYANAMHDHGLTHTAPGHFAIASGRHPGPHGVLANRFYDVRAKAFKQPIDDDSSQLLGIDESGVSHRAVPVPTLGDWLKAAHPGAKVHSVSGKDRSAIFLAGLKPDGVYWYHNRTGRFTSADAYMADLPDYVKSFNDENPAAAYHGKNWDRIHPAVQLYEKLAGPDMFDGENRPVRDPPFFPHRTGAGRDEPGWETYKQIYEYPWIDELTMALARRIVAGEDLGGDSVPDLLCISLTAVDSIGHAYGPNSQEVLDAVLRVDRLLGDFLKFIEARAGARSFVVALTADHGMMPLTQWSEKQKQPAERIRYLAERFSDRIERVARESFGRPGVFEHKSISYGMYHLDEWARSSLREVMRIVRREAESETWIEAIYDREQFESNSELDAAGERMRRSFSRELGPDFFIVPKPYHFVVSYPTGTGHGTPHSYDRHVPLILYSPRRAGQRVRRDVRTVDIAPTAADFMKAAAPEDLDGALLHEFRF